MCVWGGRVGQQTAPQLALRRPTLLVPAPRASGRRPSHGPPGSLGGGAHLDTPVVHAGGLALDATGITAARAALDLHARRPDQKVGRRGVHLAPRYLINDRPGLADGRDSFLCRGRAAVSSEATCPRGYHARPPPLYSPRAAAAPRGHPAAATSTVTCVTQPQGPLPHRVQLSWAGPRSLGGRPQGKDTAGKGDCVTLGPESREGDMAPGSEECVAGDRMETRADRQWACWSPASPPPPLKELLRLRGRQGHRGQEAPSTGRRDQTQPHVLLRVPRARPCSRQEQNPHKSQSLPQGSRPRLFWATPSVLRLLLR